MLRRLGNKSRVLPKLLPLFPDNITTFIDMFMGSGAVTFAMVERCKYVISNDKDNDVFNLFMMVKERKDELLDALTMMPVHESLMKHWRKTEEHDPIWQAVRFLMRSNFGYMGKPETLHFAQSNNKKNLLENIQILFEDVKYVFHNSDGSQFLAYRTP